MTVSLMTLGKKVFFGVVTTIMLVVLALAANYFRPEKRKARHYHKGVLYSRQGNFSQAAEEFRFALDIDPEATVVRFALAKTLLDMGNEAQGRELLSKILEKSPAHTDACYTLVTSLLQKKKYYQALEACKEFLQHRPEEVNIIHLHGQTLQSLNQQTRAEHEFRVAIAIAPDFAPAYLALARLYWETKRQEKALSLLQKYLREQNEEHFEIRLQLGRFYQSRKENQKAAREFDLLYQKKPSFLQRGAPYLAMAWLHEGELELAVDLAKKALAAHPSRLTRNPILVYVYARGLIEKKKYQAAIRELEWAKREWKRQSLPLPGELLYSLAVAYTSEGKKILAATELQELIHKFPHFLKAHLLLIKNHLEERQFAKAKHFCNQALLYFSAEPELLFLKVKILIEEGNLTGAEEICEQMELLASGKYQARLGRALLFIAQDNLDAALKQLLSLLKQHGDDHYLLYLVARIYYKQQQLFLSLEYAYQALELMPSSPSLLILLAEIRIALHAPRQAIAIYQKLRRLLPQSPEVKRDLAYLYLRTAQHNKALEILKDLPASSGENLLCHAKVHMANQNWSQAREALLKISSKEGEVFMLLAKIARNNQDFATARQHYRVASEISRSRAGFQRAVLFYLDRQWSEASLAIESYLQDSPQDRYAIILAVLLSQQQGDYQQAYQRLQQLPFDNWLRWLLEAELRLNQQQLQQVRGLAAKASSLNPTLAPAIEQLFQKAAKNSWRVSPLSAIILLKLSGYSQASLEKYEELPRGVQQTMLLLYLKVTLVEESHLREKLLRHLIISSQFVPAYERLAVLWMKQGKHQLAYKLLRPHKESSGMIGYLLGRCSQELGKKRKALYFFHRFENKEKISSARRGQLYLQISRLYFGLGKQYFGHSLQYALQTLKIKPYQREALIIAGQVYYARKDYSQAESFFQKAYYLLPDHPAVLYRLILTKMRLKRWYQAQDLLAKLKKRMSHPDEREKDILIKMENYLLQKLQTRRTGE